MPRCLFVSDHDDDRLVLMRFLRAFSIEVEPAQASWSTNDVVAAKADLVLIDLGEPEQALWPLIDDKRCTHVGRVVLMAAQGSVARLMKLCVDAVLVKVFEPADLVDVVRDVARIARRRRAGALLQPS